MKIGDRIKTKDIQHPLLTNKEGIIVDIKPGYYIVLDDFKGTDIVHWFGEEQFDVIEENND